jgi:electron transfer flavoprotein alpha subunit
VAGQVAARQGWGLTGDAIGLEVGADRRLLAWKPAFGGRLVAPIESDSPVQMVTVRPGVLRSRRHRVAGDPPVTRLANVGPGRIAIVANERDDAAALDLLEADRVIGVGTGVEPHEYHLLEPLRRALGGAPVAATRRVTDRGWLPHSRQVGITGHSIAPRLYVAIGLSGRFNHMVGVRKASAVLAIDADAGALVFDQCDVGIVGDWHAVLPELVAALDAHVAQLAVAGQ